MTRFKKEAQKREPFERLTWVDGKRQAVVPEPLTDAQEAEAVLMALGGFACDKCNLPLSASQGYGCCNRVYCPICGTSAGGLGDYHQPHCLHLVMRSHNDALYFEAISSTTAIPPAVRADVKNALKLTVPAARRLPSQKAKGLPVWSEEQTVEAYGDNSRYLTRLFGKQLRGTYGTQEMNGVLLEAALQPDVQTTLPRASRFDEHYFCTDPEAAWERIKAWTRAMEGGIRHLRTLPPTHFE